MEANQPQWPRQWLMTDERIGDRLWEAIDALPTGGGIIFRHYSLSREERRELGAKVAETARERGLMLGVAGSSQLADELGVDLAHNPDAPTSLPLSMAVHDERQAEAARLAGAALIFVGPVYPTRSHPGGAHLGPDKGGELARLVGCPAIALGGMDLDRFSALQATTLGAFHGYAGIDCWLR